ncbi:uncharacterized protein LOC130526521 isoform X1 [Takifugu flavidus]|uniref:uncharacterized protein LOC130526521 isoform X1 n=1 Tax=Takifugu flavidus TaxID=433684 RepID=UPI00254466BA|nr:uncharacterized protein LOC130526521 isoform X1 [Takifugu flavidus]
MSSSLHCHADEGICQCLVRGGPWAPSVQLIVVPVSHWELALWSNLRIWSTILRSSPSSVSSVRLGEERRLWARSECWSIADVAGRGLPSAQVPYGGNALIGGRGGKVYIRHWPAGFSCFPPLKVWRGCSLSGWFDQLNLFHGTSMLFGSAKVKARHANAYYLWWSRRTVQQCLNVCLRLVAEGWCFLPPSFRLERFAVRARVLVCTGQLAAGWCQWVALPQREPLTEWWRHQIQSAQITSPTGPTAALAQSFSSGLSPVRSRSLPSLPFARRNGAET